MVEYLSWIALVIGLTARVFVPWLAKRRQDPTGENGSKWNFKKYVLPQLLSLLLVILVLPLVVADLNSLGDVPYQANWILGWGAGDLGRKTYKALADEEW